MTLSRFLIEYYPIFFVWGAGIAAVVAFRRSQPLHFKMLAIFIFLYALCDTIGAVMAAFYGLKNHFYYNILYGIQYLVISFFYYHILVNRTIRKIISVFFIVFPVLFIVNSAWIQGFYTLQTYSLVFGGCFMLLYTVAYIWQVYTSTETQSIYRDCTFWFSLAWLFYYGLNVPYLGMLNYLLENYPEFALSYYLKVIDLSDCLRSSLLIVGFLCMKWNKK